MPTEKLLFTLEYTVNLSKNDVPSNISNARFWVIPSQAHTHKSSIRMNNATMLYIFTISQSLFEVQARWSSWWSSSRPEGKKCLLIQLAPVPISSRLVPFGNAFAPTIIKILMGHVALGKKDDTLCGAMSNSMLKKYCPVGRGLSVYFCDWVWFTCLGWYLMK